MSETPHTPPLRRGERLFDPMIPKSLQESAVDTFRSGRDSSREIHGVSAGFVAKYDGWCERCKRTISIGDDVHYHNDYPNVVHVGCHDYSEDGPPEHGIITGRRKPALCDKCWLEHNGECP